MLPIGRTQYAIPLGFASNAVAAPRTRTELGDVLATCAADRREVAHCIDCGSSDADLPYPCVRARIPTQDRAARRINRRDAASRLSADGSKSAADVERRTVEDGVQDDAVRPRIPGCERVVAGHMRKIVSRDAADRGELAGQEPTARSVRHNAPDRTRDPQRFVPRAEHSIQRGDGRASSRRRPRHRELPADVQRRSRNGGRVHGAIDHAKTEVGFLSE